MIPKFILLSGSNL